MSSPAADYAELLPFTSSDRFGVEVMRTWYRTQTFARHTHPYFTVGIMLRGVGTLWSAGVTSTLRPGDVVLIPPGEVHTGGLDDRGGVLSYMALHIPVELVGVAAQSQSVPVAASANFGTRILADEGIARALRHIDAAVDAGADTMTVEAEILAAIDFVARYGAGLSHSTEPAGRGEPEFVRFARAVIDDCYADSGRVSLHALAALAGVSPFHLAREFKRVSGLAPHQYLIQTRIHHAARLLVEGLPISDAAATVGFADQSHLTTHFRRHVGVTPATWRRAHRGQGRPRPGAG
jgi:AraC-like DNA-binding protein